MPKRKILAAAALSAAVATGGVVGATLGTPGVSLAQDGTTTTEPSTDGNVAPDPGTEQGPRGHGFGGGIAMDTAAETLGMTEDELRSALDEGKTLAEIAEAQGVDRQALIDAVDRATGR